MLGLLLGAVALYLLPTIIACARKVVVRNEVVLLNLLLGWTAGGWICALILACGPRRQAPCR